MVNKIVLDSSPLSAICHPRSGDEIRAWVARQRRKGSELIISEIIDYELRRELIRAGKTKSIERLDFLKTHLTYLPLDTPTMLRAAELWAEARQKGRPTAMDPALDIDVILAAQAERVGAMVATENVGHLSLFVEAKSWRDIL